MKPPFVAGYVRPGTLQEEGTYPRTGAYFHQLASVGAAGSAQKFLAELVRANVDRQSWSVDPFYGFRKTANKVSFAAGGSVVDEACRMPEFMAAVGNIRAPSEADKRGQGFQNMTSAMINAYLSPDDIAGEYFTG